MHSTYSRHGFGLSSRCKRFLSLWLLSGLSLLAADPTEKPSFDFKEVYDLLKANLAGTSEADLNQAAVRGLFDQLSGKVSVVGDAPTFHRPAGTNPPVVASILESNYGYIRFSRVVADADKSFRESYARLAATNRLKGLVLDLRFADGTDYSAAVALADRFFAAEQPLADWGDGWKKSTAKTNSIALPVAILVNRHTSGAAEALAGILRHCEIGLLIGTNTAGQASMAKEFSLKTGQRLRLAVAPLKVGDGKELPFTGIKADIEVDVSPEDELAWYEDAYKNLQKSLRTAANANSETNSASTNRAGRRRINEAELVRMSKEGQNPDREPALTNAPGRTFEPPPQVINDPALARALDLLKGLAVVQQFRAI